MFSSVSNGTYTYNCLLEAKLRIMCHIPMKKQCHYLLQLFQLHDFILFLLKYLDFLGDCIFLCWGYVNSFACKVLFVRNFLLFC